MAINTVKLQEIGAPARDSLPRTSVVPIALLESGMFSDTSNAVECFAQQKFSSKLQAYMAGYANSIYSYYSVYK